MAAGLARLRGRRRARADAWEGARQKGARQRGHLLDEAFLHRGERPPLVLRVLLRRPVRRRFPCGSLAVAATAAAAAAAAARGAAGRDRAQRRHRAVAVGGQTRQPRLVRVGVRVSVRLRVRIGVRVRVRVRIRVRVRVGARVRVRVGARVGVGAALPPRSPRGRWATSALRARPLGCGSSPCPPWPPWPPG